MQGRRAEYVKYWISFYILKGHRRVDFLKIYAWLQPHRDCNGVPPLHDSLHKVTIKYEYYVRINTIFSQYYPNRQYCLADVTHCSLVDIASRYQPITSNNLVTLAMVTGNIPFSFARNRFFQDILKVFRPSYSPPSRQHIAGPLHNELDMTATTRITSILKKASFITMISDCWKNVINQE